MNCKYYLIRSKNYKYYIFCNHPLVKHSIDRDECYSCKYKEYKEYKSINSHKKKRTLATSISLNTKQIVWKRDKHKCIFCQKEVPLFNANAHLVKRSQGGLGIPENLVTACDDCHYEEDMGKNCKEYEMRAETYLKNYYGSTWERQNLIYKKEV